MAAGLRSAGFAQDAIYLIRPDMYVALARSHDEVGSLQRYLDNREILIEFAGGTHKHAA